MFNKNNKILPIVFPKIEKIYKQSDCSICTHKLETYVSLPCGHIFHSNCILEWLEKNMSCPICRMDVMWDRKYIK